jgi:hypothetical protein
MLFDPARAGMIAVIVGEAAINMSAIFQW